MGISGGLLTMTDAPFVLTKPGVEAGELLADMSHAKKPSGLRVTMFFGGALAVRSARRFARPLKA
jgi:hypothetical protein